MFEIKNLSSFLHFFFLSNQESSAIVLSSRYKHAQVDVEDATERADAAVKALMYKTRGLDFLEGKATTEVRTVRVEEERCVIDTKMIY